MVFYGGKQYSGYNIQQYSPILQKIQRITHTQMPHLSSQIIYFLIMKNIVGIPDLNRGEYI